MLLAFAFLGSDYFLAMYAGQELDPATLASNPSNMVMGFIIMMVCGVLIAMLSWFATPLIALQSVGVFKAMGMSFKACLKNWLALTVFGFVMVFWMIVSIIPLGLGLFVLLPIISISIYTSYRKIFTA